MLFVVKVLIIVLVLANTVYYLGPRVYPGLGILFSWPSVGSPYCSIPLAVKDASSVASQNRRARELAARSFVARADGPLELWKTPSGDWWVPKGRNPLILPTLLSQQERNIYGDAEWGVRSGDFVLDVGAHVGVYTRKVLDASASLVVAIEPGREAVECLKRNFRKEASVGIVKVYPKGVWDSEGELELFDDGGNSGAGNSFFDSGDGARSITVPVTTLDAIVQELKLDRVDFIKADVKGATVRALKGARHTIQKFRPRIAVSTEDSGDSVAEIVDVMKLIARYRQMNGPCVLSGGEIRTDVIFFAPDE